MHITLLQENLLRALSRAARIVPAKPQLPVVANVLLQTEEGRLKVTATNLETTESILVGAKIEQEGGICVSSRLLLEFVSTLPQVNVELRVKDGSLSVKAQGFHAVIPGVAAGEFPQSTDTGTTATASLEKDEFVRAMSQVIFAAATDEGRPLLTGIRILQKDQETLFAATDGFRLSVKRLNLKTKEPLDLLIPARALSEVVKVSLEEKEEKTITITRTSSAQLVFGIGDTQIQTRLIDGAYPNFEKIIPATHNTRVKMEKSALLSAVKSAAIFARDNANIVKFHVENALVTVSANTPQVGENSVDVEAEVEGEGGDMAINSRFLLECLSNFPSDEVIFEMTGSLNPAVFTSSKEQRYLHIIMPVRVQG
jgi:DNA polymerase III subunit beta